MLLSGAEMIRSGSLQAERTERPQSRNLHQPAVIKAIDLGGKSQGEGRRESALARFAKLGLKKPQPETAKVAGYGVSAVKKLGEILDIYA